MPRHSSLFVSSRGVYPRREPTDGIEFYHKTIPRHKIKLSRAGYNQTNNYISLLCDLLEKPPLVTETLNTFSMIRFNTLLPLVLLVLGVSSCQKADIDVVEHEPMTVSLNLAGDFSVDVTQDPLTRAASTDDAYALNVYYDKEGDGSVNDIYAYGLFDNVADMTITLLSNHKYDIYCSLIRDAKTYLSDYFSLTNNGLALTFDQVGPFHYYYDNGYISESFKYSNWYLQTNRFFYNSNQSLYYYNGVDATTTSAISSLYFEFGNIRKGELLNKNTPPAPIGSTAR